MGKRMGMGIGMDVGELMGDGYEEKRGRGSDGFSEKPKPPLTPTSHQTAERIRFSSPSPPLSNPANPEPY